MLQHYCYERNLYAYLFSEDTYAWWEFESLQRSKWMWILQKSTR